MRAKISGTPECPRLNVFRSEANIYAQIIDDVNGVTLASASSLDKAIEGYGGNVAAATPLLASWWPSALWPRASRTSCLTAAAISITAVCRLWLRAPVKGGLKF